MQKENNKKTLAVNTIMLYVLTFANYFFSFMTVPYQTRVLGPEVYGVLGFAFATMTYFQLVMDFGFTLSGTAEIARIKENKRKLAVVLESIIISKLILFLCCAMVMLVLCNLISQFTKNKIVFWICLLYTFMNTLIPDFLYRGMEEMKPITYRTIVVKFIFTIGVFITVKKQDDYMWVPIMYLIGSFFAVIVAYIDVKKRFCIKLVRISINDVILRIKESFPFFVSRIASTLYGATNTVLLGIKYSGQSVVGYYTSADKVVSLARSGSSPIADSLYPYLITHKDFKLVKKILCILMPIILCGATILFIFAPGICSMVFGKGYESVAVPLRCLIPVIVIILPSYILGFPMMTPLGIAKYANLAVVIGAIIQIVLLLALWILGFLNIVSICISTSVTEIFVFSFRAIIVWRTIKKNKFLNCNNKLDTF